jgi:two-component system cell cycle sensor histidine kinase/response regulator CckA
MSIDKEVISEIRHARVALEEALANSGFSVSQQDTNLVYTYFYNTHPGIARENLIGKTDDDWLDKVEAAKLTKPKKRALDGKKGVREVFMSTLSNGKSGDIYYNDIRVEPIWDNGEVVGIYTVAIDITAFQKAVIRLEKLNGELLDHLDYHLGIRDVTTSHSPHKGEKNKPQDT